MINPKCCDIPHASVLSRGFATIGSHNCDWQIWSLWFSPTQSWHPWGFGCFFPQTVERWVLPKHQIFWVLQKKNKLALNGILNAKIAARMMPKMGFTKPKSAKIWSLFGCESHFCNALQRAAQHEAAAAAGVTSEMVRRPPWSRLSEGAVGTRDGNWDGSTNEQWEEKTWECLGFIRGFYYW